MLAAKKEDFCSNISQYISIQICIFLLIYTNYKSTLNTRTVFPNMYKPP